MRLNSKLFTAFALVAVLGLAPVASPATSQAVAESGGSIGDWLGRAGAKGVTEHTAARDFASELAESGEFDPAMTEWLRQDAAYNERMIKFHEQLIEAAANERGITDPKATAPSQALQQWIAEQDARMRRDDRQAGHLAGDTGEASKTFETIRTRNAMQAASEGQAMQRWTTVVIDSTGEVIVNDQADASQAQFEDLMRRDAENLKRLRGLLAAEVERQKAKLATLERDFDQAKLELRSLPGAPTSTPTSRLVVDLDICAEKARVKFAEAEKLSGSAREAREKQAEAILARCEPIGEEINRRLGREEIDRQRQRLIDLEILEPADDSFLVPLVPPSPGRPRR